MRKIVLTYGDVNGIGVEILIKALNDLDLSVDDVFIAGSSKVFEYYSKYFGLSLNKEYKVLEVDIEDSAFEIGKENKYSGEHCFQCLKKVCEAVELCAVKNIVTAPVSKHVLNMAGHKFSGQTEILEHFLAKKDEKSEMFFVANDFRMLLATRHLPLKDVPDILTSSILVDKISMLHDILKKQFKIQEPTIGVLALNPHAGENGLLGKEEENIINPALNRLREMNINVFGPLVPDAAFAKFGQAYFSGKKLPYDCYVSMYHDQGLIPVKLVAQDLAVNTTIGLSAIRTSPSHGTAFDIAGKNLARIESMKAAIKLALELA